MQQIAFTDAFGRPADLFPFTLTRKAQDLRLGILTIREKWERTPGIQLQDEEAAGMPGSGLIRIAGNLLPSPDLLVALADLAPGQQLLSPEGSVLAARVPDEGTAADMPRLEIRQPFTQVRYPWDLVGLNDQAIRDDFRMLTEGRSSASIPSGNTVIGEHPVFIEPGATVAHCHFNTSKGPVYIGTRAEIMEGSFVRGPFAIGEGGLLKMGAKVYGATSIGPYCIAAGEIKNSILFGYSNKAHDGYLGDSVIGEWCNFGAGTTNSNLKNNAGEVRMWTPGGTVSAGNKCGVMMGDYTRTSINTSINTGTVIGVSANVFGAGLTPKYIPSFSWGSDGNCKYDLEKALNDISNWKKLKNRDMTEHERHMLRQVYQQL